MPKESASYPRPVAETQALPYEKSRPWEKCEQYQEEAREPSASLVKSVLAWFYPFLLGLGTSFLLWLSYYPLAWGFVGWFALIPLLALARTRATPKRIYIAAWVAGLAFFVLSLQWMRVADYRMYYTWIALSIYCALYFPLALFCLRCLDRLAPLFLVFALPLAWTASEFLRTYVMEGFPWYYLGHTQHSLLPVIQVADLGGAYLVSFLVALVNGLIFEWLATQIWFRKLTRMSTPSHRLSVRQLVVCTALVAVLIGGALGYGFWRLGQNGFGQGPRVALIQGNLDQRIRNEASDAELNEATRTVVEHFRDLTDRAVGQETLPDLVVWPETSYPRDWVEVSPLLPEDRIPDEWKRGHEDSLDLLDRATKRWPTNLLLGMTCEVLNAEGKPERYNSAVLLRSDVSYGGRYDKIHRVPFGEYVPLRESLPWMNRFAPYDFDYSIRPGQQMTRFHLGQFRFGVLICYEDTDPDLAREYAKAGESEKPVDFLVNISNDGWFNGTSEHEQHLAICRFRAVECRRAVARAVNMGISAVIDGNGRVVALPGPTWAESKRIPAVLTANIPIDDRASLYVVLGDWLPWTCWLIVLSGLVWNLRRRIPVKLPLFSSSA